MMEIKSNQVESLNDVLISQSKKNIFDLITSLSEFQNLNSVKLKTLINNSYFIFRTNNIKVDQNKLNIIVSLLRRYGLIEELPENVKEILCIKNLDEETKMHYYFEYVYLDKSPFNHD